MDKAVKIQFDLMYIMSDNINLSVILKWTEKELECLKNYEIIKYLGALDKEDIRLLESLYCAGENMDKFSADRFKLAKEDLEYVLDSVNLNKYWYSKKR